VVLCGIFGKLIRLSNAVPSIDIYFEDKSIQIGIITDVFFSKKSFWVEFNFVKTFEKVL
jgi:hypothetical protein